MGEEFVMSVAKPLDASMISEARQRRFEERYIPEPNSGCWLWIGATNGNPEYGWLGSLKAHRISYAVYVGPIPHGLLVRHKCDNTYCVNPEHLELGTHKDNTSDSIKRGRFSWKKLTLETAREIFISMDTAKVEAKRHGVCEDTVKQIRRGSMWPQVSEGLLPHPKSHLASRVRRESSIQIMSVERNNITKA
jgi:hypothetical protein